MRFAKTLIAASLLLSTVAFAADGVAVLGNQQGTVLVNQGEEFVTAGQAQSLKAGDRVMVMEGGAADITFNDGCVLALAPGSLAIVPALSTCAGSVAAVEQISPSYAQAIGAPRDQRCEDSDYTNNDFDGDGDDDCRCEDRDDSNRQDTDEDDGCPIAYLPANNTGAGWIFGGWTAGIAWALIDGNYTINPVSP